MSKRIPVLFGTETGNSEYCAETMAEALCAVGIEAEPIDMYDFEPDEILNESTVIIITSTYGNGDPPENAADLLAYLQDDGPDLSNLRFAICGLGDSSFTHFAQCGKDFETALLGGQATKMFDRVDCDGDFELPFERFKEATVQYLQANPEQSASIPAASSVSVEASAPSESAGPSRDEPYSAPLAQKRLLSRAGSAKETMHYELDISGSGLDYRVGDCFGIVPPNDPADIRSVLAAAELSGDEVVTWDGGDATLSIHLQRACIQRPTVALLKHIATLQPRATTLTQALVAGDSATAEFMNNNDVIDVLLGNHTTALTAQSLVSALRKIQPRLYSIASSPTANPSRVAFTIETVRYQRNDRSIKGLASCWLADRLSIGDAVPTYVVKNDAFLFPTDGTPVIMVGPGTGIAPFRAYLQEVEAAGLSSDTWLFFGHQHQDKDFLYKEELQAWLSSGTLNRADFAWSRDQEHKVYVQHRIQQRGAELWSWLQRGAIVYVCGDANHMAPDVETAFAELAESQGNVADGRAWLAQLKSADRYRADVY